MSISTTTAVYLLPTTSIFLQIIIAILIPLVTVLFAIVIYKRQKRIDKNNEIIKAANIIMSEIRYAEAQIRRVSDMKERQYDLPEILPFNSWFQNQNLFVDCLDRDDFDLVSRFYSSCINTDKYINQINNYKPIADDERSRELQRRIITINSSIDKDIIKSEDFNRIVLSEFDYVHNNDYWYIPNAPIAYLKKYISEIVCISTTTTGEKLKNISKGSV